MENTGAIKLIGGGIALFIIIIIVIAMFPIVVVGAGERGVVFNNASGIENRILGEGVHTRIPLVESVHTLSIKVQKTDIKAEAASKDLQTVNTDIVVNWHLDSSKVNKIYQKIGDEDAVRDSILTPAVQEVVKAATAKYTASEVIAKRAELKNDIDKALSERIRSYNILLDDVSITNVSFSAEFNQAIEQKQIAQQKAEQAQFTAEQAKNDAQAAINRAQGEAESQRLQQQTLTPDLLEKLWIEKWDGHVPTVTGGDGTNLLFQVPGR
jgi:regulator of protease activity HflC (stomatin/prohibitin superfamily)